MSSYFFFLLAILTPGFVHGEDWDIYWRDFNGKIPKDAVPGADGLFIGQVLYEGFLIPGTLYPKNGTLASEYYGKFEVKKDIKVLCSGRLDRVKWERVHVEKISKDLREKMIEGGFQNDSTWYIGRIFHQNKWKIGKVDLKSPYIMGLLVWNDDESFHRAVEFDVLTYV